MRRERDFYPTPAWATRELIARVPIRGEILEPCAGRGDMARELGTIPASSVLTNDLDPSYRQAMMHADATEARWWKSLPLVRWVVTNPPFGVAHRIVPLAREHAREGIAMLLRLTYLEPCDGRASWLAEYPPTRLIVLPRISFTGDGRTDAATCAWFVWERYACEQQIEIVTTAGKGRRILSELSA